MSADRPPEEPTAAVRWNIRHAQAGELGEPSSFVTAQAELLWGRRTAVDLAGGTGATALWLAAGGVETTLVDVSDRALEVAQAAARDRGVSLQTVLADLESEPLPMPAELGRPQGWDIAVCANFLHRPLLASLDRYLTGGGIALVQIATVDNLALNERPSRRFLVERGELLTLCPLQVVSYEEGWFDGRHEARLVGRKP